MNGFIHTTFSGKIYGVIKDSGKPIKAELKIKITTLPDTSGSVVQICSTYTDEKGAYRLYVKHEGNYLLKLSDTILYKDKIPAYMVRSYKKSIRYNLIIEQKKKGDYTLRRE